MSLKKPGLLEKIQKLFFYLAFFTELIIVLVDKSDLLNPFEGRLFQITFLLFAIVAFTTKYSKKELGLLCFFGIVGVISYFITERNEIIRVVVFVAAAKTISVKEIMKVTFFTVLTGVIFIMGLSILGIYGNVALTANYGRGAIETRYCLGMGHPNSLHCMIWSVVTTGLYLYHEKMKWFHYVILFLLNIILYLFTTSRTGIIITAFTILFTALYDRLYTEKQQKLYGILGILLVAVAAGFSIICGIFGMENKTLLTLDQYLTGRIFWSAYQGGVQTWSLFSNPENTLYFDMGFIRLFYWYGFIPAALYIISCGFMIWDARKRKDTMAYMVIAAFTVYTVVEAHSISVYFPRNLILLLLAGSWSRIFYVQDQDERYSWQHFIQR